MLVTDLWLKSDKPTISAELFPARNEKAAEKLNVVVDKLAALSPDFISVTFGAGGSTREGSYQLVRSLLEEKKQRVLPYFSAYGLSPADVDATLSAYRDLGIGSVLMVRGDAPRDGDFQPHPESFRHASELLTFANEGFDFCLGAAAYPEGHAEAENLEKDLDYLRLKVKAGASFLIANYFWDNKYFFALGERCASAGIEQPLLPGIMPVYSLKQMEMLSKLSGASIPKRLRSGMEAIDQDDKSALADFGIEYALEQCRGLLERGVPGLHFYTMDRAKATVAIVTCLREEGLL